MFCFKSSHVIIFNLFGFEPSGYAGQQNCGKISQPAGGQIQEFDLMPHSFALPITSDQLTTDAVFEHLIFFCIKDFVQVMQFLIF